jgi:hypothetical protein
MNSLKKKESARLSELSIWEKQRTLYKNRGVNAWSETGVPMYLTSSPRHAEALAETTVAFLKERQRMGILGDGPHHIIDFGAGTGRFAYLYLKAIENRLPSMGLSLSDIKYVFTDITEKNAAFWQSHLYLKRFWKLGICDYAYFEVGTNNELYLQEAKYRITSKGFSGTHVVIGNYFFDTLKQDVFQFKDGRLYEGEVSTQYTDEMENEKWVKSMKVDVSFNDEINPAKYYDNPRLNHVLEQYAAADNNERFVFTLPTDAFHVIEMVEKWFPDGCLMLTSDQGPSTWEQVSVNNQFKISKHGCFSVPVNYHAVSVYFKHNKMVRYYPEVVSDVFFTFMGVIERTTQYRAYGDTVNTFSRMNHEFNVLDYMTLFDKQVANISNTTLEEAYLWTKLGGWDPSAFYTFYDVCKDQLKSASASQKKAWLYMLRRVDEHFYAVSYQEADLYNRMGICAYIMEDFNQAIYFFERACSVTGEHPALFFNLGLAYYNHDDRNKAAVCFIQAERLDKTFSIDEKGNTPQECTWRKKQVL